MRVTYYSVRYAPTLGAGFRGGGEDVVTPQPVLVRFDLDKMPTRDLFAAAELNVFFGMRLGKVADGLFFFGRWSSSKQRQHCMRLHLRRKPARFIPAGVPQHLFLSPREPCKFGFPCCVVYLRQLLHISYSQHRML